MLCELLTFNTNHNILVTRGNQYIMKSNDYSLTYQGKKNKEDILKEPTFSLIELTKIELNKNDNWFNKIIWGDNIEALRNLITTFKNSITLVYIDPPFSTNETFKNRFQNHAYNDLLTGAEYIEFIRERLILLKELLSDNGSIYVHLDNKMIFEIKIIMDEIFGSENFRNCITRKKCNRKNYTKNQYGNISDYILFYTKTSNYVWNRPSDKWSKEDVLREFPCIEESTGRRYKKVPLHAPGIRNGETGKPWKGLMPPIGKHWQYTPEKLDELDRKGEIYWSPNGNPRRKHYYDEKNALPVQDIWLDFKDITNQNTIMTGYPTEKNAFLIDRIIEASSNENDLVLDCFSGSGTTVARAERLNRKWISIDIGLLSIKTTLQRLTEGARSLKDIFEKYEQTLFPINDNPEILKHNCEILYVSNMEKEGILDLQNYLSLKEEIYPLAYAM